jgi:hypothetical protein
VSCPERQNVWELLNGIRLNCVVLYSRAHTPLLLTF